MTDEITTTLAPPAPAHARGPRRPSSLAWAASAATFLALALALGGVIFGVESIRIVGVLGTFLLGPGSAVIACSPTDDSTDEPLLLFVTGLAVTIAISFVMIETGGWQPDGVFDVLAALIFVVEVYGISRWVRQRRVSGTPARTESVGQEGTRSLLLPSLVLTGIGTAVWMSAAFAAGHIDAGIGGFLATISPAWYVGLALVAGGVILAPRFEARALAFATASIVLALTLTPALVYGEPRSTTAAKHVGVTLLLMARHRADPSIDIYNAWPGFFSAMAWVCDVAGIHDPMTVARWWPVLMGGLEIVALVTLASKLLGTGYRAWMAALLGYLVNTVGQDYYSPQSVAFVLALVVLAASIRVENATRRSTGCRIGIVVVASLDMAVTHQLTPYTVTVVLVVLVLFGYIRHKWVPVVPFVPAVVWALLHWHSIRVYLNAGRVGNLTNFAPPKTFGGAGLPRLAIVEVSAYSVVAGGVILGVLALWALFGQRSRLQVMLACCCVASVILGLANPYGGEAVFRGVLFASAWLGIMAVSMPLIGPRIRWALVAAVPLTVATFLLAAFGLDGSTVIRSGDLVAERAVLAQAGRGSVLLGVGTGNLPVQPTSNYPNVYEISRTAAEMWQGPPSTYKPATDLRQMTVEMRVQYRYAPSYWAIWSPTQVYFEEEYGVASVAESEELEATMVKSGYWKPVLKSGDTVLFRLDLSRAPAIPALKAHAGVRAGAKR